MRPIRSLLVALACIVASSAAAQTANTVEIDSLAANAATSNAAPQQSVSLALEGSTVFAPGTTLTNEERLTTFLQQNQDNLVGSLSTIAQIGSSNRSVAAIIQSAGTSVGQLQFGDNNTTAAVVAGGALNNVGVRQRGNQLTSAVLLVNSVGTTVIHDQTAGSPYGGAVVINGVPGTVVVLP